MRCVGVMLSGDTMDVRDRYGDPILDDTFLLLFNAYHEPVKFTLPGKKDVSWEILMDTRHESGFPSEASTHESGEEIELIGRSMALLRLGTGSHEEARHASWRYGQKVRPAAPPRPPLPSKHEPIDPTTAGPRQQRRSAESPKTSDLAQGGPGKMGTHEDSPPLK